MDWNRSKDKMWNGIGWYGFIGPTTSTTDISLVFFQYKILEESIMSHKSSLCWQNHKQKCVLQHFNSLHFSHLLISKIKKRTVEYSGMLI